MTQPSVPALLVLVCSVSVCCAETVTLEPVQDNTIYEQCGAGCPDGGSNGQGVRLFAGRTGSFGARRALLQFNVADALPAGVTVTGVDLVLSVSASSSGNPNSLAVHRLTASWGEGASDAGDPGGAGAPPAAGDASWIYRFYDTVAWTRPGADGDYVATASASVDLTGGGEYTWSGPGLVADVQAWIDDPASDHGVIVMGGEDSGNSSRRIGSRENPDPAERPRLVIAYSAAAPVPAASALGMYVMGAVLLMAITLVASRP